MNSWIGRRVAFVQYKALRTIETLHKNVAGNHCIGRNDSQKDDFEVRKGMFIFKNYRICLLAVPQHLVSRQPPLMSIYTDMNGLSFTNLSTINLDTILDTCLYVIIRAVVF